MKKYFLTFLLIICALPCVYTQIIHVDSKKTGRTFEGIGALSAGASSRLLIDYPEPQRSRILDYLFKRYHRRIWPFRQRRHRQRYGNIEKSVSGKRLGEQYHQRFLRNVENRRLALRDFIRGAYCILMILN